MLSRLAASFRRLCARLWNISSSAVVSWFRFAKHKEIDYTWWAAGIQGTFVLACYVGLFYYTPPPGLAMGVLAVAAVFMAVRADRFMKPEKAAWIVIASLLFFVETRSIYTDRQDLEDAAAAARNEQAQKFRAVADGLEQSNLNNQRQFEATMQRMKVLWSEATGGNSYLYFNIGSIAGPIEIDIPEIKKGTMVVSLRLEFVGTYPLRDVKLQVFGDPRHHLETFDYGNVFPPQLGSMQSSPELTFSPNEAQHFFYIFINASNGSYEEMVLVHKVGDTWLWACNLSKATGGIIHPSVVPLRTWAAPGFPRKYIPTAWLRGH